MRHGIWFMALLLVMGCSGAGATSAQRPTVEGVLTHLKAAGLPLTGEVVYTAETDTNELLGRPNQYTGKALWKDSRIPSEPEARPGTTTGGTVEVFANEQDLKARQAYVGEIAKTPLFAEYAYAKGLVLVRVSKSLTPAQAAEYERAVASLP